MRTLDDSVSTETQQIEWRNNFETESSTKSARIAQYKLIVKRVGKKNISYEGLAAKTSNTYGQVYRDLQGNTEIKIPTKKERTIEKLKSCQKRGISIEDAATETNISAFYARTLSGRHKIGLESDPGSRSYERIREKWNSRYNGIIKDLVEGKCMDTFKKRYGLEPRKVRYIERATGLAVIASKTRLKVKKKSIVDRKKRRVQQLAPGRKNLLTLLTKRKEHQIDEQSNSDLEKTALEYAIQTQIDYPRRGPPLEKMKNIYLDYLEREESGESICLADLEKKSGITEFKIRGLLVARNLISAKKISRGLSTRELNLVDRSSSDLCQILGREDICEITGISQYMIHQYRKKNTERTGFISLDGKGHITTRLVMEIYRASDLEFNTQEIMELLDITKSKVTTALSQRKKFNGVIITALNHLYNTKEIKKPYLSTRQKKRYNSK